MFCPYCGARQAEEEAPPAPEPTAPVKRRRADPAPAEEPAPAPIATETPAAAPSAPLAGPTMDEILAALRRIAAEEAAAKAAAEAPAPPAAPEPKPAPIVPPPPKPKPKKKNGCLFWVLGLIGLLIVVSVFRGCVGDDAASTTTQYVTREVNVRPQPSPDNTALADLQRGEKLTGEIVTGQDGVTPWLKVTEGTYRGDYVWARNLSPDPRPELVSTTGRKQRAKSGGGIRKDPNVGAPELARLAAGESVLTVGVTADGWVEVALRGGGVGYVRREVFAAR